MRVLSKKPCETYATMCAVCCNRDTQAIVYQIRNLIRILLLNVYFHSWFKSQLLANNRNKQRKPSLISYESNLFGNARANLVSGDIPTHQPSTSRENDDVTSNQPVANAEIETEIGHLKNTIEKLASEHQFKVDKKKY